MRGGGREGERKWSRRKRGGKVREKEMKRRKTRRREKEKEEVEEVEKVEK